MCPQAGLACALLAAVVQRREHTWHAARPPVQLLSWCDRYWGPLEFCQVPGAFLTRLPFVAPMDHILGGQLGRGGGGGHRDRRLGAWGLCGGVAVVVVVAVVGGWVGKGGGGMGAGISRFAVWQGGRAAPHDTQYKLANGHAISARDRAPHPRACDVCPSLRCFPAEPGAFGHSPKDGPQNGPVIHYREYSFLMNERTPKSLKAGA